MASRAMPGSVRDRERAFKKRLDVRDDVEARIGRFAIVHDDHGHAAARDKLRHVGIALQAPDVIHHCGALIERPFRHFGLHRVDRDRCAEAHHGGQHGREPTQLLHGRNRFGPAVGSRQFRADVDDVGAVRDHLLRMGNRHVRLQKYTAVGKRIRRDVQNAHDDRAP